MVQANSLVKVIVICGPTGSGKSKLAVELAKICNGEIISADSIAIYKGLNIGAAKPTVEEQDGVIHHMIDVCAPTLEFSVADYKEIRPIFSRYTSDFFLRAFFGLQLRLIPPGALPGFPDSRFQ